MQDLYPMSNSSEKTSSLGIISKNAAFFFPYAITLIIALGILLLFNKDAIHLYINQLHSPFQDMFFTYFTWLGDGIFAVMVALIFFVFRFRYGIMLFLGFTLSGIVVQIMKKWIFVNHIRPYRYFSDEVSLHLIEGARLYKNNSFPSGHTTTAFALFLGIALLSNNKWIKILCLITAWLVGYSRVYLSQHFLVDITAGSLLGIFFSMMVYFFMMRSNKQWLDKSIIKL